MCFRSISKADIEQGELLISKRYRNRRLGEYLKELDLIDVPMYSKIERGERRAKREQMVKLAEFLNQDKTEFLSLWLADKILDVVESEDAINLGAIKLAHDRLLNDW
ncbi:MAG: helix-turn-helix domain-containing protein [Prevotella sp.]|nr:helix-turn-helix domain-containing protein [Prevotella sp.]